MAYRRQRISFYENVVYAFTVDQTQHASTQLMIIIHLGHHQILHKYGTTTVNVRNILKGSYTTKKRLERKSGYSTNKERKKQISLH